MPNNCAIDFHPTAFTSSGPQLMGLNAANEGFLNGFIRHANVDTLVAHTRNADEFSVFKTQVADLRGGSFPVARVAPAENEALGKVGALLHTFPGIGPFAWHRRFASPNAYSVVGLTHTTATHAVMDSIGNLLVAPVEPWDAVVCTSQAVRKTYETVLAHWEAYLVSRMGATRLTRPQLPVIPLGVDTQKFVNGAEAEKVRAKLRVSWSLDDKDIVVLWMGRFSHTAKAHPVPAYLALEAMAKRVSARIVYVQAGWFASAEQEASFKDAARSFAPSVMHIFVDGREPAMRREVWAAADIFMSLSDNLQETFGLTPIEAMAAKLPVVVSDWDGYRDTVRDGLDGFLIPTAMPAAGAGNDLTLGYTTGAIPYGIYTGVTSQMVSVDVAKCTEALVTLAQDADLRHRMGEAGLSRARERYDWRCVIAQYQDLFESLAQMRAQQVSRVPRLATMPAFPLRADPFDIFSSYPTQALTPDTRLTQSSVAPNRDFQSLHLHELNRFSSPWRASQQGIQTIHNAVRSSPGVSIGELCKTLDERQRLILVRTVAWMLKMDLIKLWE